jgi:hypothetical protein
MHVGLTILGKLHRADPLVPEPGPLEIEIAIEKLFGIRKNFHFSGYNVLFM